MSPKKLFIMIASVVAVFVVFSFAGQLIEVNSNGNYQILQSVSGELTTINKPGPYWQGFGTVTTYPYADTINFSNKDDRDGDDAQEVRFSDNGTAKISGFLQYSMPKTESAQLSLHQTYKSYSNFKDNVVGRMYRAALIQTASLMRAEESYSQRRSEFRSLSEEQLEQGLFETTSAEERQKNLEGNDFIERITKVKLDNNGKPIVKQASPLAMFDVTVMAFTVNEIDFDATVDALFAKKKEAEQQRVVARANAERAKQDAITAEEQGKAKVAVARAEKEVEKIEAVTSAEKEAEVARLNKLRDREFAEAELIKRRADAESNKLLVNAGLTPEKKAQIQKETAIGVAAELAKITPPQVMVFGGGNSGSPMNPLDAMGLEAYMNVGERLQRSAEGK